MYPHPPANYQLPGQYYRQGPHYPSEHGTPVQMPPGPNPPQMNEPPQMAQYPPPPPVVQQQPAPIPMETDANGLFFLNFITSNMCSLLKQFIL